MSFTQLVVRHTRARLLGSTAWRGDVVFAVAGSCTVCAVAGARVVGGASVACIYGVEELAG
jgi:hypothetical protein